MHAPDFLRLFDDSRPGLRRSLAGALLCLTATGATQAQQSPYLSFLAEGRGDGVVLGDVDGDGWTDYALGDPRPLNSQPARPGHVDVLSGFDGSLLYRVDGYYDHDRFGLVLATVDDLDGDGIADLVASAGGPIVFGVTGSPYLRVISGASGSTLYRLAGNVGDSYAVALASLGDVDADGRGDFAVGSETVSAGAGEVQVISGVSGTLLRTIAPAGSIRFGAALERYPDLDGDGIDELAVGDPGGNAVHLVSPVTGSVHQVLADAAAKSFGASLAAIGDADGDGVEDLAVGAPDTLQPTFFTSGRVVVYSGASWTPHLTLDAPVNQLSLGLLVSGYGDWDQDGRDDFVAAWPSTKLGGSTIFSTGKAELRSGRDGTLLTPLSPWVHRLRPLGDIDGDGVLDMLTVGRLDDDAIGGNGGPWRTDVWLNGKPTPFNFCFTPTSFTNCEPHAESTGTPSATFGPDLTLTATGFTKGSTGFFFYSLNPQVTPTSFGSGLLCSKAPFKRFPVGGVSNSSPTCGGTLTRPVSKAEMVQFSWLPGTLVSIQAYGHAPSGGAPFGITDGLLMTIWP